MIPAGVKIALSGSAISVQGPKGSLQRTLGTGVDIAVEADQVVVTRRADGKPDRSQQGLIRTLIANMVEGVTTGYARVLEINGVGYRADLKGNVLNLALGYSHPVEYQLPEGISAEVEKQTMTYLIAMSKSVWMPLYLKISNINHLLKLKSVKI
jgi:large subunit ribosomal protein L6